MSPRVGEERSGGCRALVRPYLSDSKRARMKFQIEKSALLVTDMQRYFLDEKSHAFIPSASTIARNIEELVVAFRKVSRPVIFTRHALLEGEDPGAMGRWWGDVLRVGDPLSEIPKDLAPLAGEVVIRKTQYSAFAGTELEKELRRLRISQLVITGVQTHLCCESTARDAFTKGFDVYVVEDATGSKTDELHVAALKTLAHGFAVPVTTREVVQWLG